MDSRTSSPEVMARVQRVGKGYLTDGDIRLTTKDNSKAEQQRPNTASVDGSSQYGFRRENNYSRPMRRANTVSRHPYETRQTLRIAAAEVFSPEPTLVKNAESGVEDSYDSEQDADDELDPRKTVRFAATRKKVRFAEAPEVIEVPEEVFDEPEEVIDEPVEVIEEPVEVVQKVPKSTPRSVEVRKPRPTTPRLPAPSLREASAAEPDDVVWRFPKATRGVSVMALEDPKPRTSTPPVRDTGLGYKVPDSADPRLHPAVQWMYQKEDAYRRHRDSQHHSRERSPDRRTRHGDEHHHHRHRRSHRSHGRSTSHHADEGRDHDTRSRKPSNTEEQTMGKLQRPAPPPPRPRLSRVSSSPDSIPSESRNDRGSASPPLDLRRANSDPSTRRDRGRDPESDQDREKFAAGLQMLALADPMPRKKGEDDVGSLIVECPHDHRHHHEHDRDPRPGSSIRSHGHASDRDRDRDRDYGSKRKSRQQSRDVSKGSVGKKRGGLLGLFSS
ncbi:hypothetical protein GGR54DRAFT_23422 [Hypoxylon sp. NC1633]|nr:hypothetical protein GGR54DRAFT_23422 [Hypoxylon sp. NC1633]